MFPPEVKLLFARGTVGYGGIAFGFLAFSLLPLAEAQVLQQTVPAFAAVRLASFGELQENAMQEFPLRFFPGSTS